MHWSGFTQRGLLVPRGMSTELVVFLTEYLRPCISSKYNFINCGSNAYVCLVQTLIHEPAKWYGVAVPWQRGDESVAT